MPRENDRAAPLRRRSRTIFHAGTRVADSGRDILTDSGRALTVVGRGANLDFRAAREAAYRRVNTIHWDGEYHRNDIAAGL